MVSRDSRDRSLPTLITLLVLGVLLMTYSVRVSGGGVEGVLRSGTQTILAPFQKGVSYVLGPLAELIDSLGSVATLREENRVLRQELAEAEAGLIAVQDQLARLRLFEQLYGLEAAGSELGRTVANVIGRPDAFDAALIIDKGSADGIAPGQPVIDTNGYVVGSVKNVTAGTATIVPIVADRQGLTVIVGSQVGTLLSQVGREEMRLEIFDAREPVLATTRVLTSAVSARFPAGLPVGEVIHDAVPAVDTLTTLVMPYVDPDLLRIVIVLAWPPDPVAAALDDVVTSTTTSTTTTTLSEEG
ncbi:MAG TPA: rod shape-determining protein MreC [Acidimicrobiia bacterium]|nr:rod shape-determining protein MreC [Acidimicrobiia bacterium]